MGYTGKFTARKKTCWVPCMQEKRNEWIGAKEQLMHLAKSTISALNNSGQC
jgi:hypothetical protein